MKESSGLAFKNCILCATKNFWLSAEGVQSIAPAHA